MTVTEEEAAKLWCPEARTSIYIINDTLMQPKVKMNLNRPAPHVYCIGSKCMAWSWNTKGLDGYCGKVNSA